VSLDLKQIRGFLADGAGATASPAPKRAPRDGHQSLLQNLKRELRRMERRSAAPWLSPAPAAPAPPRQDRRLPPAADEEGMVFRERFEPGHAFGGAIVERPSDGLLLLLERLLCLQGQWTHGRDAPLRPEELLFFDLETTGLSRSAGTFPFLTGLGAWTGPSRGRPWHSPSPAGARSDDGALEVEQLLLRDPSMEPRALERLGQRLARARVLISFNGRSFDLPILRNRDLLNRAGLDLDGPAHLDLLHPCRRLFRTRLENCRLGTMEQQLLGFRREGDVEGAEAPRIYQEYLRTGREDELAQILEHNKLDVALMAPLLNAVVRHAMDPLHWAEDGEELLGAARLHLDGGDPALGEACLRRGLELARAPATRRLLLSALAQQLRRHGRRHDAGAVWEQFRREFPDRNVGWIELAKYHEHVTKDLPRALELAERSPMQHLEEHQHRLRRLRRRVARLEQRAS